MIVPGSTNLSDDSDDDENMETEEIDKYPKKYKLLMERCEILQQDNERLVHRIQQVRKLLRRSRKERKFLIDRLDQHGDNWRDVPLSIPLEEPHIAVTPIKQEKIQYSKSSGERTPSTKSISSSEKVSRKNASGGTPGSTGKRKASRNSEKAERDPNAPKRPANPFFQFCQEQRPIVMERLGVEQKVGEPETSKQELTRQLASKWNTLPPEDKKIYYDMYEKSKEKYAAEMQVYTNKAKIPAEEISNNITI